MKLSQVYKFFMITRKNMIIMEFVKAMIHDKDMTMNIWVEVSIKRVYVHNRAS